MDAPGLEQIRVALNHSLQGFMICDDGKPIGMARLLGDYAMAYLIKDVAMPSEYQHRGAGTLLMLRWDTPNVLNPPICQEGFRERETEHCVSNERRIKSAEPCALKRTAA